MAAHVWSDTNLNVSRSRTGSVTILSRLAWLPFDCAAIPYRWERHKSVPLSLGQVGATPR
jgi:hypothetical protein